MPIPYGRFSPKFNGANIILYSFHCFISNFTLKVAIFFSFGGFHLNILPSRIPFGCCCFCFFRIFILFDQMQMKEHLWQIAQLWLHLHVSTISTIMNYKMDCVRLLDSVHNIFSKHTNISKYTTTDGRMRVNRMTVRYLKIRDKSQNMRKYQK